MTATRISVLDLGLVTLFTAGTLGVAFMATSDRASRRRGPIAIRCGERPADAQQVAPPATRPTSTSCTDPDVVAVVVRGRITSLEPEMMASFRIRLADVPSRYEARTGEDGRFEVRIPVAELEGADLCNLPIAGARPAVAFAGAHMQLHYELTFEK